MNTGPLFDSVLTGLVESFSPVIEGYFRKYEPILSSPTMTETEFDQFFTNFFNAIPKHISGYMKVIKTVTDFAKINQNDVLGNLASKFKSEINRSVGTPFSLIQISSLNFRLTNIYHFHFLRFFTLFILSDIISKIFLDILESNTPSKLLPFGKIVPCGFHVCQPIPKLNSVQKLLIKEWGMILHSISLLNGDEMALCFTQFVDDSNIENVFYLLSFVRAPQELIDSMLISTQQAKRKKGCTTDMLTSLSGMLSISPCEKEILQEYFNLAWGFKSTEGIKNGAIDLITALFQVIPAEKKKEPQFYRDRVYKHINNPTKIERTARAFLRLLRGDVQNVNIITFEPEEYAGCKGDVVEPTDEFIKKFYLKANFETCPEVFIDIIVQLAAIDADKLSHILLPDMIEKSGIYHSIVLSAISHINTQIFKERSKVKPAIIDFINDIGHTAILQDLSNIDHSKLITYDNCYIQSHYGSTDSEVYNFITSNKLNFEASKEYTNNIEKVGATFSMANSVVSAAPYLLFKDNNDPEVIKGLISLCGSPDPIVHYKALKAIKLIYTSNYTDIVEVCINIIKDSINQEITKNAIDILYVIVNIHEIDSETALKINITTFILLQSKLRNVRAVCLAIMHKLSFMHTDSFFNDFIASDQLIQNEVATNIGTSIIPDSPSHTTPIEDAPTWQSVARSSYSTLWNYYYSVLMSLFIEAHPALLPLIREQLMPISKVALSDKASSNPILFLSAMLDTFANLYDPQTNPIIEEAIDYAKMIISSKNQTHILHLIQTLPYLNYRVIPSIVRHLINLDSQYYSQLTRALSMIIKMPTVFLNCITFIFESYVEFLSLLQSYLFKNNLNSQRDIKWDQKILDNVKVNEDICIDYCIIVATFFNNIQTQIDEEQWALSNRQCMVKILIQWINIPGDFTRLHNYSINALIPLIAFGTIFTDGFAFEPSMLDRFITVQQEGYPVIDSLLMFHVDILMKEFISQVFLRPHAIAQIFITAILNSMENCNDPKILKNQIGSMILFAQELASTDNFESAIVVLSQLGNLFVSEKSSLVIQEAKSIDFVFSVFEFATEQIILFGMSVMLEMIHQNMNTKHMVELIQPWFAKIRILPTNAVISNIPKNFRCYTVLSFFQELSDITMLLDEEQSIYISNLWVEVMKETDNSKVTLAVIYATEDIKVKTKIFTLLCDPMAGIVAKFLAKRCRFSFWYYQSTQDLGISDIMWAMPILQTCFTEHLEQAAPYYSTVLHFCLLYYEECQSLCQTLFMVFPNIVSEIEMLNISGGMTDEALREVARTLSSQLGEDNKAALDKWSLEAIKWGTCCKSLKQATRSIIILDSIEAPLNPFFPTLLNEAVTYQLSCIYDDYTQFSKYMSAVFQLLSHNVLIPQLTGFAYEFAMRFVNFEPLITSSNRFALTIFIECFRNNQVAARENPSLIVDAFAPFLIDIASNPESQEMLENCIDLTGSPELILLNSIVMRVRIPCPEEYDEALKNVKTNYQANRLLFFFGMIVDKCSEELISSVLGASKDLLDKFRDQINDNRLIPICKTALKRIVFSKEAAEFIYLLAEVNPTITSLEYNAEDGSHTVDDVISGLQTIATPPGEKSPITNCKEITMMTGMISQDNPPKIYPFNPQDEMVRRLKNKDTLKRHSSSANRHWSSALNLSSKVVGTKTTVFTAALQMDKIEVMPLLPRNIRHQILDLPSDDKISKQFLVTPLEFMAITE
ncbi:hypothetical protein TVAG_151770 [Trichomonas vaginalis G3]|uniref:Uncharacterized protein n=1 Tax=Trichomonas vaginalis (strain ATCC PRA-98 / G3) TaxID=412133 RepID=A2ELU2_TRIV3|nr:armadillo (ARM) repeat-containing protein family [Trichomonas vaginalis G3]EAY06370.1 hypothetical protein TVAG_151770 [Trichomonas vaginalis G3]KAI5534690.1 armadillo (ARM) repeat-containing protein family [Trichomonas vaginalis G3]|eukprot:XP_001318593.1 hypothetical protein [Trichomonas vaginalis G3]